MQHLWFMERVIDFCGHKLGIPADEMRLRNYIQPEEFPYTTPNGCVYDSGNYPKMLEVAKGLIGWEEWKSKQREARAEGRMLGIGIGTTLDSGTNNFGQAQIINPGAPYSGQSKAANVKLDIYGEIVRQLWDPCRKGRGTKPPPRKWSRTCWAFRRRPLVTCGPALIPSSNVYTGHTGTYASQFAVTGLSAHSRRSAKTDGRSCCALAAFALDARRTPPGIRHGRSKGRKCG